MKKRMSILLLALFVTVLTACGTSGSVSGTNPASATSASSSVAPAETAEQQAAKKTIENFFVAFAKEDYATMKTYCTKQFAKDSFGKNKKTEYWYGFKNAALQKATLVEDTDGSILKALFPDAKSGSIFDLELKGETVPESSSWMKEHPVQETLADILLQKVNGNWKLAGITTG